MPGVDLLRSSENAASQPIASGSVSDAPRSIYTGTGKSGSSPNRFSLKTRKKGLGALLTILILCVGGGTFLGSSNTLLAPAIEALFHDNVSNQNGTTQTIFANLMRYSLRNNGSNSVDTTGENAWKKPYQNISEKFSKQLSSNGIEVDGNTLKWGDEIIDADNFMNNYNNNFEFRGDMTDSRYGNIIDFYDTSANDAFQDIRISRNIYRDYTQTGDAEADDIEFRNTLSEELDGNSTRITTSTQREEEVEVENEDGSTSTETKVIRDTETSDSRIDADDDIETATVKANSYLSSIATVTQLANWGCTAMQVSSLISASITALETFSSYTNFMGMIENVSKMKAGYGDESAINSFLNFLNTSATTTIEDFSQSVKFTGDNGYDKATTSLGTKTITGTPLEANGVQMIMSGAPANYASLQNFSLERTSKSIFSALAMTGTTVAGCAASQATSSVISIATTFASGGLSVIGGYALKIGASAIASISVGAFLSFLIPTVAKVFFMDPLKEAIGIPGGETFARGAGVNLQLAQSANSQAPSSKNQLAQYNRLSNQVAALDAEADRLKRSPFDITSRNTFLGSIAYSLLPAITSGTTSTLGSILRTTAKSLGSLTGSVSAEGEGSSYLTTYGDCPQNQSIGAEGTVYCNTIPTTDVSMLNTTINNEDYSKWVTKNTTCDSSGKCKIKEGSDLAHKITVCDKRLSSWGVYDAGIASMFSVGNALTDAIPVLSDVLNVIDSANSVRSYKWATGEYCGNTDKNAEFWNSDMKYAQHFVQEQRILEQMGAFENGQSLVSAYLEEYDKKHPADNSPSGVLARISGISKDDADIVLAFVDYYKFLEDYDASTRIALTDKASEPETSTELIARLDSENTPLFTTDNSTTPENDHSVIIIASNYLYTDIRETLRDRSLIAWFPISSQNP